jgi:hypothetical protein
MALRLVVTGAAGYIAEQLVPVFRERYDCTLLDVRDVDASGDPVDGVEIADLLTDEPDRLRGFFRGRDVVVHLAHVQSRAQDLSAFAVELSNVRMAFNVFRLAVEEGVRRVVVASSNHAADFYEPALLRRQLETIEPMNGLRPLSDNFYGWAKEVYEHLGFVFASGGYGPPLENVHIRIGAPRPIERDMLHGDQMGRSYRRNLGAYISPRDLAQLFVKSIEAEDITNEWGVPWQVFYGISSNTRAFWSIANAREVVGYDPQDDSEVTWAEDIFNNVTSKGVIGRL